MIQGLFTFQTNANAIILCPEAYEQLVWASQISFSYFFFPKLINIFGLANGSIAHLLRQSLVAAFWLNNASCANTNKRSDTNSEKSNTFGVTLYYNNNNGNVFNEVLVLLNPLLKYAYAFGFGSIN